MICMYTATFVHLNVEDHKEKGKKKMMQGKKIKKEANKGTNV